MSKIFTKIRDIKLDDLILTDINQNTVLKDFQQLRPNESLENVIKTINQILIAFGAKERPWYEDFDTLNQNEEPLQLTENIQITIVDGVFTQTEVNNSESTEVQKILLADHILENIFYDLIIGDEDTFSTIKYQKSDLTDEQLDLVVSEIIITDSNTKKQYKLYIENQQLTQELI